MDCHREIQSARALFRNGNNREKRARFRQNCIHITNMIIISLKYQIQTPGWVHQLPGKLSSCLLACSFRAGSTLSGFLCVFPKALHNKQREKRRWPAMLRNVLYGGFRTQRQPGIPFSRCLMGISCSSMSSAGRAWLRVPKMRICSDSALHSKCEGCVQNGTALGPI